MPSRTSGGPWRQPRPRRTARPVPDLLEQGVGGLGAGAGPDRVVAGHRQHLADLAGFQLGPQPGIGAVDLIAGHPGGRDPGGRRPAEHPVGQCRLGRKPDLVGDAGGLAAVGIAGPAAGHVQVPVDQGVPGVGGIDQVDRDLGVVDLAGGAGVLALHPTVLAPFLRFPVSSTTSTACGSPRCSTT
jgi:hypothetical protein